MPVIHPHTGFPHDDPLRARQQIGHRSVWSGDEVATQMAHVFGSPVLTSGHFAHLGNPRGSGVGPDLGAIRPGPE